MIESKRTSSVLKALKARWRDQTQYDHDLSYSARSVAYAAADFMTMEKTTERYLRTGKIVIFCSQETLAERVGCGIDTIRLAVAQLIDRGHLIRIVRGNQRTGANRYRIIVKEQRA